MADRSTNPQSAGGPAPDHAMSTTKPPRAPRWVKVLAIIGIVLALLIVIALATGLGGPGDHGPRRHQPSGDADGPAQHTVVPLARTALAGVTEGERASA